VRGNRRFIGWQIVDRLVNNRPDDHPTNEAVAGVSAG
jgi:hypothetical protein